ncbi:uncharacterized protein Z519_05939 [Cladophialophora bantiana CBS 173.52]|uniref:J domain-containing protein n=1 Tax=Cladophialophora bantiana (strain ATCC 10958 / CBS 173.52 / CDC B-1940 / NIH 8579) TaxID=1442370 RepID=A0A0D2I981_CLAB1|nr:uncharacterized protein Z519_05939 [Cladophialophora bantiana CBS 173.52]KIW93334.1 hypothetical protein Z519_05939 [Cladophialophora bantiana CBS 173.52]
MSEASDRIPDVETAARNSGEGQRPKRFRFKSKKDDENRSDNDSRGHKRRRNHDSSHRRRKRHRSSRHAGDGPCPQEHPSSYLSPDQAFRESLFDALGDDEGAAFWESVYGQPIHNYPNTYQDEETGELERMTDEEYAQFVRRKMWEKSWEGIEAAREEKRREKQREEQRIRDEENRTEGERQTWHDDHIFTTQIEASLRRGEKRKERKRWQNLWEDYLRRWADLLNLARDGQKSEGDGDQLFLRNKIAWPVESGKRKDVKREEIERFIRKGTESHEGVEGADPFSSAVKAERVRWHPDKIQQRYGFMDIDDDTLKGVTAVFQVLDTIWNEIRDKAS